MKQKLLALAALLATLGAGAIVFVNFESAKPDPKLTSVGNLEVLDLKGCTTRACNAGQCIQVQNILVDAGSSCLPRFAACDMRIGQALRNKATDAGVALGPQKYQRLEVVALRCPAVDGGFSFGVPFDDAGWPLYAATVATPLCVRAPLDGGQLCRRSLPDGGTRFNGKGNVFPASQAAGSNCDQVACSVFLGDNPDTSL